MSGRHQSSSWPGAAATPVSSHRPAALAGAEQAAPWTVAGALAAFAGRIEPAQRGRPRPDHGRGDERRTRPRRERGDLAIETWPPLVGDMIAIHFEDEASPTP